MKITILKGDITEIPCDAIVNAANTRLKGGGGVDGAIHKKAGPGLRDECAKIGHCPTGESRVTNGYKLKAKYIIHTVGPVWSDGSNNEDLLLMNAYKSALSAANNIGIRSIAFPNISTGIYGFPKKRAAEIAAEVLRNANGTYDIEQVYLVCFEEENFEIYKELLREATQIEST